MPVTERVNTNISYGLPFIEWDAAVSAGLNLWRWETGGYPVDFKERVIAFHNMRNHVKMHEQDAVNREQKRRIKRGGR